MIGPSSFRGEQQEENVNRLTVESFEIDRFVEPGDQTEDCVEAGQLAVGYRDAFTDPCGAKALALQKGLVDGALGQAGETRRLEGELLKSLLFAVDAQGGQNGLGV